MNRRKAIGLIAAASAGTILLPGCIGEGQSTYTFMSITRSDIELMNTLSNQILPIPEEMLLESIGPVDFMLTMVQDCESPENQGNFAKGFNQFKELLLQEYNGNAAQLTSDQLISLMENDTDQQQISFLLKTFKRYHLSYYTSLEAYLNNYTDWEFAPGRFEGCVAI